MVWIHKLNPPSEFSLSLSLFLLVPHSLAFLYVGLIFEYTLLSWWQNVFWKLNDLTLLKVPRICPMA